ncbi:MAG: hypothetical protein RSB82_00910 [Victivallaceae bacterium]
MKKSFVVSLTALLFTTFSVSALPVGNPGEAGLMEQGIFFAGSCTEPHDPCSICCGALSLRTGFYADYVFNRILRSDVEPMTNLPPNTPANPGANPSFEKDMFDCELFTSSGYFALNLWNVLDVFGTLGSSKTDLKGSSAAFNLIGTQATAYVPGTTPANKALNNATVEVYSNYGFAWSVGARRSLWENGCATLGIQAQYSQAKPTISQLNVISAHGEFQVHDPKAYPSATMNNSVLPATTTLPSSRTVMKYNEWQGGIGLSYSVNMLTPYIAVKWSRANFKMGGMIVPQYLTTTNILPNPELLAATPGNNPAANGDFQGVCVKLNNCKTKRSVGFVFGATLMQCEQACLTGELRMIDENAVYINGQIRF